VRAAYVSTYDSADVRAWSGLGYHIGRCLELGGIEVERLGPLERRGELPARMRHFAAKLRGLGYELDRDPRVAGAYAAEVARRLQRTACDVVFSPGTIPIAYLRTAYPIAFWTDATFGAMVRSYPEYGSLSRRAIRAGFDLDARALDRAALAVYASEWAARSAVEDHGGDADRIDVVPFGANMPITHDRDWIVAAVGRRPADSCRLLFVGVDWARKGGDRAIETARILNKRGLPTELDLVGSSPSRQRDLPPWVRVHGFVDKTTSAGATLMRGLFEGAHLLIHPASAEAFGVVFCEAAGHGVVSIASNVGGIPSAVRDGVTGILCDPEASGDHYADQVWRLLQDRSRYESMAVGAFDEYTRALSWEAHAVRVKERLGRLV
jgi:glycosyltransferase involved in cell wall biosynthesis